MQRRVTHLLLQPGGYSEVWLDAQLGSNARYSAEAWSQQPMLPSSQWNADPHHIRDIDRFADLALRIWRSERLGGALRPLASHLASLASRARARQPDVLHAHFGTVGWMWLGLVDGWTTPMAVSFYGFDASMHAYRTAPWTDRYAHLFRRASAVIVEGPAMASRVEALGAPSDAIHIVRLPFTNDDLPPPHTGPPAWDLAMVGRFVEKKGFEDGLAAFAASGLDGRLLLVGSGPREQELRASARQLGIADRVDLQSPVPLAELARLLTRCRLMVFPSRTAPDGDGEGGAPLTLTLAQALRVPVVVSDHDDLPWAAAPGTPVVKAGDIDALTAALVDVHDAAKRGDLAEQVETAAAFVAREHDPARLLRRREQAYDAAVEDQR